MKPKWKDEDIKELFELVERERDKKPMLKIFEEFSNSHKRQPLSVRNFYYIYLKGMKQNSELAKKYDVNLEKHPVLMFEHFEKKEEENLKNLIENKVNDGLSVRGACLELSNGDIAKMLRYQNKYRNLTKKLNDKTIDFSNNKILELEKNDINKSKNEDVDTQIYTFPTTSKKTDKTKLTDDDIKSLFMGLVNLVKQNEMADNQKKIQMFLEKTEEDRRKFAIKLEQKEMEIDRLNQSISELKLKNLSLNKTLENYRIEFVQNKTDTQNLNNNL